MASKKVKEARARIAELEANPLRVNPTPDAQAQTREDRLDHPAHNAPSATVDPGWRKVAADVWVDDNEEQP